MAGAAVRRAGCRSGQGRVRKRHPRMFYPSCTWSFLKGKRQNALRVVFSNPARLDLERWGSHAPALEEARVKTSRAENDLVPLPGI